MAVEMLWVWWARYETSFVDLRYLVLSTTGARHLLEAEDGADSGWAECVRVTKIRTYTTAPRLELASEHLDLAPCQHQ